MLRYVPSATLLIRMHSMTAQCHPVFMSPAMDTRRAYVLDYGGLDRITGMSYNGSLVERN